MRRATSLGRLLGAALAVAVGCAQPVDCRDLDAGRAADAASISDSPAGDAGSADVGLQDAGAAPCDPPRGLEAALVLVESPTATTLCVPGDGRAVRVWIFRRGESVAALDVEGPCETVLALGAVVPGDYELAFESDGFAAGARLTHPDHCSATDPSDDTYCSPVPVTLTRCGATVVNAALYCDPMLRSCAPQAWPWL